MKYYVVYFGSYYETSGVVGGIFSTLEKAIEAGKECGALDYSEIYKCNVDGETEYLKKYFFNSY